MQLRPLVDVPHMRYPKRLTDAEKARFKLFAMSYALIRRTDMETALKMREHALDIVRRRFHLDNDAIFRNHRLTTEEWSAVKEYFPFVYKRNALGFFKNLPGLSYYERLADRAFQRVTIRGNWNASDFIIVGTEPGRKEPSVLARMYSDGTAAPHLYEIKSIVEMRRSQWNSPMSALIGMGMGAGVSLYLVFKVGVLVHTDMEWLLLSGCTLGGYALGMAVAGLVNLFKRRKIAAMYPRLCVAD